MKRITVIITFIAIWYQSYLVRSHDHGLSPILDEVEAKKALFYNRKQGSDRYKVVYVRVPGEDGPFDGERAFQRKSGMYWNRFGYGQPPLNPTGPPPGAFSPGSVYYQPQHQTLKRRSPPYSRPPKRRYKLKSTTSRQTSSPATPCPYQKLAEELVEQQRFRQLMQQPPPPPPPPMDYYHQAYPPPPTPPPTTTTTTTTTPTPSTTTTQLPPTPIYLGPSGPFALSQLQQQHPLLYQTLEQHLQQQQQQQNSQSQVSPFQGLQFEHLSPDLFKSLSSTKASQESTSGTGSHLKVLVDSNNNAYIIQEPQQPAPQAKQQQTTPNLQNIQQILMKQDTPVPSSQGSFLFGTPQLQQSQQQPSLQEQAFSRFGNQLISQGSNPQPISISQQALQQIQQQQLQQNSPQQPQIILLDNQPPSQGAPAATTMILQNGQLFQQQPPQLVQQQQQQPSQQSTSQQPNVIILNPPSADNLQQTLSLLQNPSASMASSQFAFGNPSTATNNRPIQLPDLSRVSGSGPIPIILSTGSSSSSLSNQKQEEDEPMLIQNRKKNRRRNHQQLQHQQQPEDNRKDKDKKRYVLIAKKELEEMKQRKRAHMLKNIPPPPEVVHIPFHEPPAEEDEDGDDEDEEEEENTNHFRKKKRNKNRNKDSPPIIKAGSQSSFSDNLNSAGADHDAEGHDDTGAED